MDPFYTQAFKYRMFVIKKTLICGQNGQGVAFYLEDIHCVSSYLYIFSEPGASTKTMVTSIEYNIGMPTSDQNRLFFFFFSNV